MSDATLNNWSDLAALDELWDGVGLEVQAAGQAVALFRVGDEVFATAPMCTHGDARLCEGFVEGHEVECPLHQGRFDLRDGTPLCAPAYEPLKTWPVRIAAGRVYVALG
jgi:naphthalene 1,2-dioxygenase system ferredoxin subunit